MDFLNIYVDNVSAFFIICMAIGLLLSGISLLLGGSDDHSTELFTGDLDHNLDVHSHADDPSGKTLQGNNSVSILNINTIFAYLIGFGAAGLISYSIFNTILVSFLIAMVFGIVSWYIIRKALTLMIKVQSEYLTTTVQDSLGCTATVVSKIFPDAIGEVMYVLNGANNIIRAKSDKLIEKGEKVVIIEINQGIATVKQN